jgi:DNA-binding HxlR family transcriptional regulator
MKSYGQYCPVARAAEILSQRWTVLVLRDLLGGIRRFNELRKGVPLMSPSLLSKRLKELEKAGLVVRRPTASGSAVEYIPTPAAVELRPMILLLGAWGQRWLRHCLSDGELDVSLLMWDVSMRVDPAQFGPGRTVIKFEYSDRPRLRKDDWWLDEWWLVMTKGESDLCIRDPGFDIDLFVVSDLRTMTEVWLGYTSVSEALRTGVIELHGSRPLAETFERWWPLSFQSHFRAPPEPLDLQEIFSAAQEAVE